MSQISFEKSSKGTKCLVFMEDTCIKSNNGGLGQRLTAKYISLCPKNYVKKANFYLQNLKSPHPKQWCGHEANKLKEVVKDLLSSAKIDGYFTNHSLRRSGGSHLFQAGVD